MSNFWRVVETVDRPVARITIRETDSLVQLRCSSCGRILQVYKSGTRDLDLHHVAVDHLETVHS